MLLAISDVRVFQRRFMRSDHLPPALGVFAGGRGTRLLGPDGGCKALVSVAGRPLIDYILTEALRFGVRDVRVVVNREAPDLERYLRRDLRFPQIDVIRLDSETTRAPVQMLVDLLGDRDFLLSTCDVIAPPGALSLLERTLREGRTRGLKPLAVFLSTSWVHDTNPIWIESDASGIITRYGKGIPPAPHVFGNIRLCTKDLKSTIARIPMNDIRSDTELMAAVLADQPGHLLAATTPDRVFDIDDVDDIRHAEAHLTPNSESHP